jgi:signal transduction histidine kinase
MNRLYRLSAYWRFLIALAVLVTLYALLFLIQTPVNVAFIPDAAREDAIERAFERATDWMNNRETRFQGKVEPALAFIKGQKSAQDVSDEWIGTAFRTIALFKDGVPAIWTRYVPVLTDRNDEVHFVIENGQALAVFQKELTGFQNRWILVGVTVMSGPTLIAGENILPTLEAEFKRSAVPVRIEIPKTISPHGSIKDLLIFDRNAFAISQRQRFDLLKAVLSLLWVSGVVLLGAVLWKRIPSGFRFFYILISGVLLLVWWWAGNGLKAIYQVVQVPEELAPLASFVLTNAVLSIVLIAGIVFFLKLRRLYGVVWYPRTIFLSLSYGVLSGIAWLNLPAWLEYPLSSKLIQPFDFSLLTNAETAGYFSATAVFFLSLAVFFIVLGWFLYGSEQDQITWVSPLMVAGFGFVFAMKVKAHDGPLEIWPPLASSVLFVVLQQISYRIYAKPRQLAFFSRLRLIVLSCAVTVLWTYWFMYTGYRVEHAKRAKEAAGRIMIEDRAAVAHIARVLPRFAMRKMPFSLLYEETDELREGIEEILKPEWNHFEITLYRVDDGVIGPVVYTNQRYRQPESLLLELASRVQLWKPDVDIQEIRIDREDPATAGFVQAQNVSGTTGLAALVRPRYRQSDGVFDAVFEADPFPDLESFVAAMYRDGQLYHRFFHGLSEPSYTPEPLLAEGSFNNPLLPEIAKNGFRTLVFRYQGRETLAFAYPDLGFSDHVYAVVRYFLTLVAVLLLAYALILLLGGQYSDLILARQQLQLRILDSYILSTLVFLVLLIVITHYAVWRLTDDEFQQQFERRLELYRQELNTHEHLQWLESSFSGDYLLYEGATLIQSSRPRLLKTGRISETMAFSLYSRMRKEVQPRFVQAFAIGGEQFVAGIIILSQAGTEDPLFIVFPERRNIKLQAAHLYRTTSLLIILYVFLFGLFIGAAALISRHLSKPLAELSIGLRKVSTGEFSATVPVTTQDEVGDLANAYNLMIYKLQDLQKELAEAERQAALSEMARQVAHEIKNPLTPMKLSIQFLQRQIEQRDRPIEELQQAVHRICTTVIEQIDSLNVIASDFSRFAKPITGVFKKVDINKVAGDIIELYRHDRRITIIPDLYEEPLYVHAVAEELKRVFINLVKNSDEAMPEGGVLIIRTYAYKEQLFAEVVDNGSGIPVEMQARIFTPNFSTKTSGTGLGLAICKKVVEAHHGEISFASVPGTGTTFTLVFPKWKESDGLSATTETGVFS